jgi:hypothetical protein
MPRRLRTELLERRDLLAAMRLVAWNTLNGPNDPASDAHFETVLAAIGNETIQGNTERIAILALSETDPPGAGGDSIGRIENLLDGLYPSTDYATAVSSLDGGGDSTGFVFDTLMVDLLETVQLPGSLTHSILRGKFRPADTLGESDFYVYATHLKSGSTVNDQALRTSEAAAMRADADLLGEGAHVLMVGDFNMKDSFEGAYSQFVAAGAGQVQDVAAAPGNWTDNPAFRSLHTQDPTGNMDDRFDLQFASGELFDGVGLEYVADSYHVFGNNGTHTLGGAITTGSGAAAAVLSALAAASDHLPVVADYEIRVSSPNVRIQATGPDTRVIEGGRLDTYRVVLDTVPSANVIFTATPDAQLDLGAGPGTAVSVLFTPTTALTPQTLVVWAADDRLPEGTHGGQITFSAASDDPDYQGLTPTPLAVTIVDNDAPEIVINELDSDTPGDDTREFIELFDGGVGGTSLGGLVVVFYNGATDTVYAATALDGHTTNSAGLFVIGNAAVSQADLIIADGSLQNGADAVALYRGGASDFPQGTPLTLANLLDAVVYDSSDADDPELLALLTSGPQVNEDQHGNKDFDSLARQPDGGTRRNTLTFRAGPPTPGQLNAPPAAGVAIIQSAGRVDATEGGPSDSYQLALETYPTSDVTITVQGDLQSDLGAGPGVAIELTFTPANALLPQFITVTAVDDQVAEGTHNSVITHTLASSDPAYDGLAVPNVVVNLIDNEVPPLPRIVITELMINPDSDESSPGVGEWIELANVGTSAVNLEGWLLDDEDSTNWSAIPAGVVLQPNQVAVLFDAAFSTESVFRAEWGVPANALVVGIAWGNLANSGTSTNEVLQLLDNTGAQADLVNYESGGAWPSLSSGGPSISLVHVAADNNVGASWERSGTGAFPAVSPTGPTFATTDVGSPGRVPLAGDFDGDQTVGGRDFLAWQRGFGTAPPGATSAQGDANLDGDVDGNDLAVWESQLGLPAELTQVAAARISRELAELLVAEQRRQRENSSWARRSRFTRPAWGRESGLAEARPASTLGEGFW